MNMQDWISKLDGFLNLNDRDILTHSGKISHQLAIEHSHNEYEKFHIKRVEENDKLESDFDKAVKQIEPKKTKKISKNKTD